MWAHHQQCNPSNNAEKELIKTVTSIQDCADQCRGETWTAGVHRTAKGFIYRSRENGGPGCYCEAVHSQPHEECGSLASPDWHRYDFIPAFAFMHYGECKYDTDPGQTINSGNQVVIGTGYSVDTCAVACKGQIVNGVEVNGFFYSTGPTTNTGVCVCENQHSYPHPDCQNIDNEMYKARYDFVNYSPVIELKHTWYGSCQLDQVCTEITGDMLENEVNGNRYQMADDQNPMILVTDNKPSLIFGAMGLAGRYMKMVEADFNGNMINQIYIDTRTLNDNPNPGQNWPQMTLADVTLDMWNNELTNVQPMQHPTTCTPTQYCLQDFKNPNGWNQADSGLNYDADVGVQCGRVCQGAMVDIDAGTETISVAAKGFVVNGLECICMPAVAVAGTTCQALEGCKSYDFDINVDGAYDTYGSYCDPGSNVYVINSAQPTSGTDHDNWVATGTVSYTHLTLPTKA